MRADDTIRIDAAHSLGVSTENVAQFYRENWAREIALGMPSFYDWQFRRPPHNGNEDRNCIALSARGEILGVMGLSHRPFVIGGRELHAAELTTWIVSKSTANMGLGGRMMAYLQRQYDVLLGTGITDAALPIYLKNGFAWLKYIPRYYRIFCLEKVKQVANVQPLGERLAAQWEKISPKDSVARRCEPAELADVFDIMRQDYNCYLRDREQLSWRFLDHPVFKYECYLVGPPAGGGSGAGLVVRFDDVAGLKLAHVVDLFGGQDDMDAAPAFVDTLCRERGVDAADFWCTSARVAAPFWAAGWFSAVDSPYFQFPSLFYPLEMRTPPTTSLALWGRDVQPQLLDLGRLYVSKADLDLDRPTVEYYRSHGLKIDDDTFGNGRRSQ